MQKYVKIKGQSSWYLLLEKHNKLPFDFSDNIRTKLIRKYLITLHGDKKVDTSVYEKKLEMIINKGIDYEDMVQKYGDILINPVGGWFSLDGETIIEEKVDIDFNNSYFPLTEDNFGEVIICENDCYPEDNWLEYLKQRFSNKLIATINFFDLRKESEVKEIFDKAKYITFSTTFSDLSWFEKLSKCLSNHHKVIGYCHIPKNWKKALEIFSNVEIIKEI